jgi:hypothetical protein
VIAGCLKHKAPILGAFFMDGMRTLLLIYKKRKYTGDLFFNPSFPNALIGNPGVLKDSPCIRGGALNRWVQAGSAIKALGDDERWISEPSQKRVKIAFSGPSQTPQRKMVYLQVKRSGCKCRNVS